MQSGYGGVSEIQQFMVDSCGSSLFSMSTANPNPAAAAGAAAATPTDIHSWALHPLKYHRLPQPHHPQPLPPPLPPHFHSIPITQQLFHQTTQQFQLFHPQQHYLEPRRFIPQHHLGLDQESAPDTSPSPTRIIPGSSGGGGPSFLSATMSFKLAVNESSGGGSPQGMNDDDGILQGDEKSESRLHHWRREDESAIKELPWRPLDVDYISRNNKRCKDEEPAASNGQYSKKSKAVAGSDHVQVAGGGGSSNYKIFSELEAICKPGGSSTNPGGGTNRTGSGSALTGDKTPLLHVTPTAPLGLLAADRVGGSETSAGEEATAQEFSKGSGRRRRKRWQRQLRSVAAFFESLVKQLMDHQEGLHGKFLEVMERREQERTSREDARRKQEAAKSSREAAARAHERALASSREAAIISFIEKITDVATANASGGSDVRRKDNSDLLDAIMAPNDGHSFKFSDMATLGFDFSSKGDESDQATAAKGALVSHAEHDDEEDEDDDDQGGGGGGEQYEEEKKKKKKKKKEKAKATKTSADQGFRSTERRTSYMIPVSSSDASNPEVADT
ncbi:hypothetical protein MUK42_01442 [Musa troglodytarum]|uniref:Uncharacterized protein n=1 Tax=Musa troglodytarum TaxID=320322 RepID=A0A9E7FE99_9LILI|nr:hypothetical protein MUK42_01442 [Musa troglodytarum]